MEINMRAILIIISLLMLSSQLFAANTKGIVFGKQDDGKLIPLPNATINILGTDKGTLANRDGYFDLNVGHNQQIIVSYVGYRKDTITIDHSKELYEIVLLPELKSKDIIIEDMRPTNIIDGSQMAKTELITQQGLLKAACCNLSESFQTNPSVDVTFTDAITGAKQIQLLGLAQVYTQLMTEKVPNLQGLASSYGLNFVPGPWMNAIAISKGSSSVSTGYESITGQINVEYKMPEETEKLYLNLYANDIARFEFNAISKYQVSDKFSTAYFFHGNLNRYAVDMNHDSFVDVPLSDQLNFMTKLSYNGDNYENKTIVQALNINQEAGQMSFVKKNPGEIFWGSTTGISRINFLTKNGFIFEGDRFRSLGTIVSVTHHKQNSLFVNKKFDAEQNSAYINLLWQSNFDPIHKHINGDSDDDHSSEETKHNYLVGLSLSYNNYLQYLDANNYSVNELVPGAFFEYTFSGIEDLVVMPGIRVDFHNKFGTLITPRLHLKYQLNDFNEIRASIGRGYHNPLPIAENQHILMSNRSIIIKEDLKIEEALNFGVNTTTDFSLWGMIGTFNTEYYYTKFQNQTIIDMDNSIAEVLIYNLKGDSYSHNFQVDANIEIINDLNLMVAYRYNDVRTTIGNELIEKPLISKSKVFFNTAYSFSGWAFDLTVEFNGSGRLPNTTNYPEEYRLTSRYPNFALLHGQITKQFNNFEIYLGGENLTDYKQHNPIIASNEPFSKYFDSSMIWGPVHGRKLYLGLRYKYN